MSAQSTEVKYHYVRELVEEKKICISYVPTADNWADIFSKPLMREKFQEMRRKVGVMN